MVDLCGCLLKISTVSLANSESLKFNFVAFDNINLSENRKFLICYCFIIMETKLNFRVKKLIQNPHFQFRIFHFKLDGFNK